MHPFAAFFALAATSSAMPTFSSLSRRATSYTTSAAAQNLCGTPDDSVILDGTPWIVYNMMYNYQQTEGSVCTGFKELVTGDYDGETKCAWNSTWDITEVDSTSNVPKGYSFVGLTQNLETKISAIDSIPATYHWVRTNQTAYKGNVCFDFMTSDTKGDSTSSSAQELMLWLRYEGGQLPIGYADGVKATIQLYGKSWDMYQGVNEDTGITVTSLVVDEDDQYWGWFAGDIKDWLLALVDQGLFSSSTYVNVGNAGMEPFYGTVDFQNKLGLQINLA
ncbi:hypothetical protein D0869_12125 [Hortaea werneckii]|uniref:Uncharacterized protein n=1 Tax=Hortaea werneckii TaxID=91943 RepID=A0A3M6Z261_HORWE|nr:glycoside hydrolase family 12 protein [Hortaea werneckii]KAI7593563.1 glycoside hydrolase family 12 protein [Hortaea werneckii]RMX74914.1 hypothetical protein D0869_12125 [Hortaea werneckii]RMY09380.1 hypothetical protein D0868_04280 [Hortaea werneckii]